MDWRQHGASASLSHWQGAIFLAWSWSVPLGWECIPVLTPWLCGLPYACSRVLLPHTDSKAAPSQHQIQLPCSVWEFRSTLLMQIPMLLGTCHPHIPLHLLDIVALHGKELHRSAGPPWAFSPASATVAFKNLLRTRAKLSSLAPRIVWECCEPCLLLPRAIASLAWTGGGTQVYIVLEDFSWLWFALNCSLLKAIITGALALVKPTFLPFLWACWLQDNSLET